MWIFWIGLWSFLQLTEANKASLILSNSSAAKEESLLPSSKKALFREHQFLRGDDFGLTQQNATLVLPENLNISHHICNEWEYIINILMCFLKDHLALTHFTVCIFTAGLFGNIIIFFYLLSRFERKSWTAYVWNLAVADFAILIFLCSLCLLAFINKIYGDPSEAFVKLFVPLAYLFVSLQCFNMHFLVAIVMDRCLVALIPNWHRCNRPDYMCPLLSVILSALLWPLSCQLILLFNLEIDTQTIFTVSLMIFIPLIVICTQTLIMKMWCNLCHEGNLHTEIIFGTLFSLTTWAPIRLFFTMNNDFAIISLLAFVLTSLSSTINPVLYILIGQLLLHYPESVRLPSRWFKGSQMSAKEWRIGQ